VAAEKRQQHHDEHVARWDANLAIGVAEDSQLDYEHEKREQQQEEDEQEREGDREDHRRRF
jgi:hypothetical protein